MKLPNPDRAVVDLAKLAGYCLSFEHPRGRHKAQVFASVLGVTREHAASLRDTLLDVAKHHDAVLSASDEFGDRYVVDFLLEGPKGRAAVRSTWIIRTGEDFPRLTSCYVL